MSDGQDPRHATGERTRRESTKMDGVTFGTYDPQAVLAQEAARATGVDDPVRPKHYQGDLVMRIIEHFGLQDNFYLGNVIKYLLRHKEKAGFQDLKKALWYLQRLVEREEGKHQDGVK